MYSIHEVYYDEDGTPTSCTETPCSIIEIIQFTKATTLPCIEYSFFGNKEKASTQSTKETTT